MRLPLPMHAGWYVLSYVRTYIGGVEENGNYDKNKNESFDEKENRNEDENEENTSVKTANKNIPSVIIRKRVELGKSELFSVLVPVQGVGEDVLLPCNKGVRRRGAGFLGAPIWEESGTFENCDFSKKERSDLQCCESGIRNDDENKSDNYDHNNLKSIDKSNGTIIQVTNTSFHHGIKDPRSLKILNSFGRVEMLDVTLEDLKNIKTLSVTISLPHIELNRKKLKVEKIEKANDRGEKKNKNEVEIKRGLMIDGEDVDNESHIDKEEILCRAMIWVYDVMEENEKYYCAEKNDTGRNKNDDNRNNNIDNNNTDNNDDDDEINDNNNDNNKNEKGKLKRALRIVVEADVTTLLRNKGVVTVESVRTAYGMINIDENHIIQSILTNSLFTNNNDKSFLSSNNCRGIPLELIGSTGSINRYGQFVGRIFYGEDFNGNNRSKDAVTPYPNTEQTSLTSISNNVSDVKSHTTDTMKNTIKINENKNSNKNENKNDKENDTNYDKNTNIISENTEIYISCGHCANSLVPFRAINKTLPMPTGDFDDVRKFYFLFIYCFCL